MGDAGLGHVGESREETCLRLTVKISERWMLSILSRVLLNVDLSGGSGWERGGAVGGGR